MMRQLGSVFKTLLFVLGVVPALILLCFLGLLELQFPAHRFEVHGLAVLGATAVLTVLWSLGWVVAKIRGSQDTPVAPDPPGWVSGMASLAAGAAGIAVTGATAAAGLLVITVGSWPARPLATAVPLGTLEFRGSAGDDHMLEVTYRPPPEADRKPRLRSALQDAPLGPRADLAVEVRSVRFGGQSAPLSRILGLRDAVLPWTLLRSEPGSQELEPLGGLTVRDPMVERLLQLLSLAPGVEIETLRSEPLPAVAWKQLQITVEDAGVVLASGDLPADSIRMVPPPALPATPVPGEAPGDPFEVGPPGGETGSGGGPVNVAPPPPTTPPPPLPPIAAGELSGPIPAELYPDDPFEGLD